MICSRHIFCIRFMLQCRDCGRGVWFSIWLYYQRSHAYVSNPCSEAQHAGRYLALQLNTRLSETPHPRKGARRALSWFACYAHAKCAGLWSKFCRIRIFQVLAQSVDFLHLLLPFTWSLSYLLSTYLLDHYLLFCAFIFLPSTTLFIILCLSSTNIMPLFVLANTYLFFGTFGVGGKM